MQRLLVSFLLLTFAVGLAACATPYNKPQTASRIGEESRGAGYPPNNPPGPPYPPTVSSPPATTYPPPPPPVVTPPPPPVVTRPAPPVVAAPSTSPGALIDRNNRWRSVPIGGTAGAVLGGTVTQIRDRASREAALGNRAVAYQTEDGFQRVEATPRTDASARGCRQVQERVYQNGQLVQDVVREVCS